MMNLFKFLLYNLKIKNNYYMRSNLLYIYILPFFGKYAHYFFLFSFIIFIIIIILNIFFYKKSFLYFYDKINEYKKINLIFIFFIFLSFIFYIFVNIYIYIINIYYNKFLVNFFYIILIEKIQIDITLFDFSCYLLLIGLIYMYYLFILYIYIYIYKDNNVNIIFKIIFYFLIIFLIIFFLFFFFTITFPVALAEMQDQSCLICITAKEMGYLLEMNPLKVEFFDDFLKNPEIFAKNNIDKIGLKMTDNQAFLYYKKLDYLNKMFEYKVNMKLNFLKDYTISKYHNEYHNYFKLGDFNFIFFEKKK